MLRHYLTFNITDPMSNSSRGSTDFTQYFSGYNTTGQVNYLERKLASGGTMVVSVGGVTKTPSTDYTYSNTTGEITWTGYTPPIGNDNIKLQMTAVKPWIYDDNPNVDTVYFPRLSVLDTGVDHEDSGQGIYYDYYSGPGQYLLRRIKIPVRARRNEPQAGYVYGGIHYKNYELVLAIAQAVKEYFNTHEVPPLWKFWRWKVIRGERIYSEEDTDGIIRYDLTVDLGYYDSPK